jgi:hypothetical protein
LSDALARPGASPSGGWLIAQRGYGGLSVAGLAWLAGAISLSLWAGRALRRSKP